MRPLHKNSPRGSGRVAASTDHLQMFDLHFSDRKPTMKGRALFWRMPKSIVCTFGNTQYWCHFRAGARNTSVDTVW